MASGQFYIIGTLISHKLLKVVYAMFAFVILSYSLLSIITFGIGVSLGRFEQESKQENLSDSDDEKQLNF